MLTADTNDYHTYLPPYRSLLNPNARYDYRTHSLVPISQNELNVLHSSFTTRNSSNKVFSKESNGGGSSGNGGGSSGGFKMKYKSLLSDVSRSLSMRLSNPNLISSVTSSGASTISNSGPPTRSSTTNTLIISKPITIPPVQFQSLPMEILDYIFFLVDSKIDYKSCLYTNKLFYYFAKPYYYQDLQFTSTFRFAQFISYLRFNSEVGLYVKTIDLSGIKPGYEEEADEEVEDNNQAVIIRTVTEDSTETTDDFATAEKILAGWRDWKFKNNPLYSVHSGTSSALTKISSNSQILMLSSKSNTSSHKSLSSKRFSKPFKYFKSKKRGRSGSLSGTTKARKAPRVEYLNLRDDPNVNSTSSILQRVQSPHPLINKFLLNYSTSRDVPIGYVLHLINLCPNIVSLNLGNLSLSIDYEISRSMIYKYQTFDLMNNYPKELIYKIDDIMRLSDFDDQLSFEGSILNGNFSNNIEAASFHNAAASIRQSAFSSSNLFRSNQSTSSTASSVYSIPTFSKPVRKYNSLLPPLPQTVADISYLNKGDGKVYLSDLNLKSINNNYLKKLNDEELLNAIIKMHGRKSQGTIQLFSNSFLNSGISHDQKGTLKYLNLSSMIWLNKSLIQKFLKSVALKSRSEYQEYLTDEDSYSVDSESDIEIVDTEFNLALYRQDLVIDLTDSGMYKNLQWAKKIDLRTREGCRLVHKIIHDELYDSFDEYLRRERIRRGRMGENYLA